MRGRAPPFDPQDVVAEDVALMREYGVHTVTGDNYSAEWVQAAFKEHDVEYKRSELSHPYRRLSSDESNLRDALSRREISGAHDRVRECTPAT